MLPTRCDLGRRFDVADPTRPHRYATRAATGQGALPFATSSPSTIDASLTDALPSALAARTQAALATMTPVDADVFVAASGIAHIQAGSSPRHRAQLKPLRLLLAMPPRQRRTMARHSHNLFGASLGFAARASGMQALAAASRFGTARLVCMVRLCMPLDDAPRRRAATLDQLWRTVGPHRLAPFMAMCRPVLEQRRGQPAMQADAIALVLARAPCIAPIEGGCRQHAAPLVRIADAQLQTYVGDLDENVMQAARVQDCCAAIRLVRQSVGRPVLSVASALACLQLYVFGMAHAAAYRDAGVVEMCCLALRHLTGEASRFESLAARKTGRFGPDTLPSLSDCDADVKDSYPWLTDSIQLSEDGTDRIGLAALLSLVWQSIHTYQDPSGRRGDSRRAQDNLRYSLVRALAESHVDGPVCAVGLAQRLLSVLQGYLPFVIDHVDANVQPQAVVTYMMQTFVNQMDVYLNAASPQCIGLQDAGRPKARAIFETHLLEALRYDYDCYVSTPHETASLP